MKRIVLIAALSLIACGSASAGTCKADAADKKLAGAALTSFMKKCSSDAQKACAAESKDQKLAGAAATAHTKKCTDDKVGS